MSGSAPLRKLPDGRSVCDLRLAVNDRRDQPALFVDVATFGPQADACGEHLAKGRQVAVTGGLILHFWTTKAGAKRSRHRVVGNVQFGTKSADGDA